MIRKGGDFKEKIAKTSIYLIFITNYKSVYL